MKPEPKQNGYQTKHVASYIQYSYIC